MIRATGELNITRNMPIFEKASQAAEESPQTVTSDQVTISGDKTGETTEPEISRAPAKPKGWLSRADIDENPADPMGAVGVLTEIAGVGLDTIMAGVEIGGSLLQEIGIKTGAAATCLAAGIAGVGVFFGITGIKNMKQAIQEKNVTKGVEATADLMLAGDIALRTGSRVAEVAEAGIFGSHIGPVASAIFKSPVSKFLGTASGVGLGVIETALGGKELYDGVKAKDKKKILSGALSTGMGIAMGAIALGAGLPAGIALAGMFAVDVFMKRKKYGEALKEMASSASKMVDKVENTITRSFHRKTKAAE